MADIFDVISDATRRDILKGLLDRYVAADSETGEISVGDLVDLLGLSQPTVSKHLKVLRDHGLVTVREEGQHRYYRLDATPLEVVEDWLIPYLSADFDAEAGEETDAAATAYGAWAGTEVASTIGRTVADGAYRARRVVDEVGRRLPAPLRRGH